MGTDGLRCWEVGGSEKKLRQVKQKWNEYIDARMVDEKKDKELKFEESEEGIGRKLYKTLLEYYCCRYLLFCQTTR